jgi:uncharacterized protein
MKLTEHMIDIVLGADAKALATWDEGDINVVPVSAIRIVGGKIWLANFFMGKTVKNIKGNPTASLACWKGAEGYQFKSKVSYQTSGEAFSESKKWIAQIAPKKEIKGLLILEPMAIYDISPTKEKAGALVLQN